MEKEGGKSHEPRTLAVEEGGQVMEGERNVQEREKTQQEGKAGGSKGEGSRGLSPGKSLQLEIDHILEETARKKNLSVMNVKSILRVSVGNSTDACT